MSNFRIESQRTVFTSIATIINHTGYFFLECLSLAIFFYADLRQQIESSNQYSLSNLDPINSIQRKLSLQLPRTTFLVFTLHCIPDLRLKVSQILCPRLSDLEAPSIWQAYVDFPNTNPWENWLYTSKPYRSLDLPVKQRAQQCRDLYTVKKIQSSFPSPFQSLSSQSELQIKILSRDRPDKIPRFFLSHGLSF